MQLINVDPNCQEGGGEQKTREPPLIKLKALSEHAGRSVVCTHASVIKVHFKSTALTSGVLSRLVWWVHTGMAMVPKIQGTPLHPHGPGGKTSWGRGGTCRAKTTEQHHSFPRTRNRLPADSTAGEAVVGYRDLWPAAGC